MKLVFADTFAHVGIRVKLDFMLLDMLTKYKSLAIRLSWLHLLTQMSEKISSAAVIAIVRGLGGDDTLLGGAGKDTLAGNVGNDIIYAAQAPGV